MPLHTFRSPSTILTLTSSLFHPFVTVSTESNGLFVLSDDLLQVIYNSDAPSLCSSPVSNNLVLNCSTTLLSLQQVADGVLFDSVDIPFSSSRYIKLLQRSDSDFIVLVASPTIAIFCTFSLDHGFTSSLHVSFPAPVAFFNPHSLQRDHDDQWSFLLSYVASTQDATKSSSIESIRIPLSSFSPLYQFNAFHIARSDLVSSIGPANVCSVQIPSSQLCQSLRDHRDQQQLIDSTIDFNDETYTGHSVIVSLFNDVLASSVMNSSSHQAFVLLEQLFPDPSLFITVLNSFYGDSVPCTEDNFHLLRTIALSLKYQKLEEFIQNILKSGFKSCEFQLESNVITSQLVKSAVRDVSLSYKKTTFRINSLLLSCFSHYFKNLFNNQFLDSATRNFLYSIEFPGVEEDVFVEFFEAALCMSLSITPSNVLSFYQLSVYFQVESLHQFCLGYLNQSSFTDDELHQLLSTANERGLFHFIQSNVNIWHFSGVSTLPPIPISIELFKSLTRVFDHEWLVRCLVLTATTTDIDSFEIGYSLTFIEFNYLAELFEILQPLFKNQSFELVMMNYSFKLFQDCSSIESIPREWFLWTFKAFDKNQRLNELTLLVQMFTKVFPEIGVCPNDFSQLSPKTFQLLATELNQTYSLWL
ncbi:hypothetical protein GEMRC1_001819 [Eukaryota sp. GEM-RC1]